nr:unnamed protein product [Ananas comosus var. bracteatus]
MTKTMAEEAMVEEKKRKVAAAAVLSAGGEKGEEGGGGAAGAGEDGVRTLETLLRVVPMGLCLAALVVMLKNSQSNDFGAVSYSNLAAFKYLVYANGICAAYSLFSAFYSAVPRPSSLSRSWAVFFFDQVLTYVVLAAGTVSAEVIYLAYNGDKEVTWSRECGVFGGFCRRATASVGITFGAAACYILLSLISSYRLFSTFEAPIPLLAGGKAGDIAA